MSALQKTLADLPSTLPAAVIVLLHRPSDGKTMLPQILAKVSALPVVAPLYGEAIHPGCVYIGRPDLHLKILSTRRFGYVDGTRVRGVLSSANPLLESAAPVFKDRMIAVVLTGAGLDATDGVQAVKASGGIVIAEDPAPAAHTGMPKSAIGTGAVDLVLPLEAIGPTLVAITTGEREGAPSV